MPGRVLIVDPQPGTRDLLRTALVHDGFEVSVTADRTEALAHASKFDVIVADLDAELVDSVKAVSSRVEVVVLADALAIGDALAAVTRGAFDYVLRPFFVEDVSLTVACAAARWSGRFDLPLLFTSKNHELLRRF